MLLHSAEPLSGDSGGQFDAVAEPHPHHLAVPRVGLPGLLDPDPKDNASLLGCALEGSVELQLLLATAGSFKIPRYTMVLDELPMTSSGKVQKFRLREMAALELGLSQVAPVETA